MGNSIVANSALQHLVIVGGDEHAWSAAARLVVALRAQGTKITVIEPPQNMAPGVLPLDLCAHEFHRKIGVLEPTLVANVGACYRYGTEYINQSEGASSSWIYTHAETGEMHDRMHFHQYLAHARNLGLNVDVGEHSLAALAAKENRFTHPQANTEIDKLEYTINVDRLRYISAIKSAVLQHKVNLVSAQVSGVAKDENDRVTSLHLENQGVIDADFVIDCVGITKETAFESWSELLNFDRRLNWVQESKDETPVIDRFHNKPKVGLRELALPGGVAYQLSFNSAETSDEEVLAIAKQMSGGFLPQLSEFAAERTGLVMEPWKHNVLNIGKSAGSAGNQMFGELFHTHNALKRWLSLLPRKYAEPRQIEQYNRETWAEFEHVRDAHLLLLGKSLATKTLQHRVELFRGTGNVAFYENDVLESYQWVNLMLGGEIWPIRSNALLSQMDASSLTKFLNAHSAKVSEVVVKFPKHDQLLSAIRNAN